MNTHKVLSFEEMAKPKRLLSLMEKNGEIETEERYQRRLSILEKKLTMMILALRRDDPSWPATIGATN